MRLFTSSKKLANPPIVEAVIDIQTVADPKATLAQLESLHEKIATDYPAKETRYALSAQVRYESGKAPELSQDKAVLGFLFKSGDGKQIVQYRMNGFTFSRLKPYKDWESMRNEAKKLWEIYIENFKPSAVQRLAVRYINQLQLPKEPISLDKYFKIYPQLPKKYPKDVTLTGFTTQLRLNFPNGIHGIINQGTMPEFPNMMLLDIDLFCLQKYENPADPAIWNVFNEHFWSLKDDIFQHSFTSQGYSYLKGS